MLLNTTKTPTWTTKIGEYTSEEDSDNDNSTHSTELGYTIAKPSPASGELGQNENNEDNEQESNAEEEEVKNGDEEDEDEKDKDVVIVEKKNSEDGAAGEQSIVKDVANQGNNYLCD